MSLQANQIGLGQKPLAFTGQPQQKKNNTMLKGTAAGAAVGAGLGLAGAVKERAITKPGKLRAGSLRAIVNQMPEPVREAVKGMAQGLRKLQTEVKNATPELVGAAKKNLAEAQKRTYKAVKDILPKVKMGVVKAGAIGAAAGLALAAGYNMLTGNKEKA